MKTRRFCLADEALLDVGFYWIERNEPDGPPFWEIAFFTGPKWHWQLCGIDRHVQPTANPNASNAWHIGERVPYPNFGIGEART